MDHQPYHAKISASTSKKHKEVERNPPVTANAPDPPSPELETADGNAPRDLSRPTRIAYSNHRPASTQVRQHHQTSDRRSARPEQCQKARPNCQAGSGSPCRSRGLPRNHPTASISSPSVPQTERPRLDQHMIACGQVPCKPPAISRQNDPENKPNGSMPGLLRAVKGSAFFWCRPSRVGSFTRSSPRSGKTDPIITHGGHAKEITMAVLAPVLGARVSIDLYPSRRIGPAHSTPNRRDAKEDKHCPL